MTNNYIAKYFGIKNIPDKDINLTIKCPFHEDRNPSAGINFKRGLFNCFKCGGLNFYQLEKSLRKLREEKLTDDSKKKIAVRTPELDIDFQERAIDYLKERGFDTDNIPIFWEGCDVYEIDGRKNPFYGYLIFESLDGYISGRNLVEEGEVKGSIWKTRPKYMNEPMPKGLFWISQNEEERVVFLVEGIFDGLTLYQMGITNVAALGGSYLCNKNADNIAYGFRDKTVIILLDNDPEGYKGGKKISEKLREFSVDHHVLELPSGMGKDLNEFLIQDPDKLESWIYNVLDRFHPDDTVFVSRLFSGETEPLNILPTGIAELDKKLTGGFKDGGHLIAGTTGIGKTSFVFDLAVQAVDLWDKRVMINSCEISKRQSYARIASQFSDYTWEELEEDPKLIESDALEEVKRLSRDILVVNGWPLKRIIQESKYYDVIVIDYIQRVREAYGSDESATRHLINNYCSKLTDLGALQGKICIIISSLDRQSYDKPDKFGLKESGSLEFMGASVSRISAIGDPADGKFIWRIQKNTRGEKGMIRLRGVNLGHGLFRNAKAEIVGENE